jgi:hypothetical protein
MWESGRPRPRMPPNSINHLERAGFSCSLEFLGARAFELIQDQTELSNITASYSDDGNTTSIVVSISVLPSARYRQSLTASIADFTRNGGPETYWSSRGTPSFPPMIAWRTTVPVTFESLALGGISGVNLYTILFASTSPSTSTGSAGKAKPTDQAGRGSSGGCSCRRMGGVTQTTKLSSRSLKCPVTCQQPDAGMLIPPITSSMPVLVRPNLLISKNSVKERLGSSSFFPVIVSCPSSSESANHGSLLSYTYAGSPISNPPQVPSVGRTVQSVSVPNQNRLLPGGGGKPQETGQNSGSFGNGAGGVKLSSTGRRSVNHCDCCPKKPVLRFFPTVKRTRGRASCQKPCFLPARIIR